MTYYLRIEHGIENFEKWKPVFDGHLTTRQKYGLKDVYVLKDLENPLSVTTLYTVEDVAKAKEFMSDPDLMQAMLKAGVTNLPSIQFYTGD
jgi:hypothetical protein